MIMDEIQCCFLNDKISYVFSFSCPKFNLLIQKSKRLSQKWKRKKSIPVLLIRTFPQNWILTSFLLTDTSDPPAVNSWIQDFFFRRKLSTISIVESHSHLKLHISFFMLTDFFFAFDFHYNICDNWRYLWE